MATLMSAALALPSLARRLTRRPRRAWLAVAGLTALLALAAATPATAAAGVAPEAAPSVSAAPTPSGPVVLVGVAGLRWQDLSATATPDIWRLAQAGSLANLSTRTVWPRTCPADGWLTLGAGARTSAPRVDDGAGCPDLPTVTTDPARPGSGVAPGVDAARQYNAGFDYGARPGALGDALAARGVCATALGPGAALALTTSTGTVARYLPRPDDASPRLLAACPLTIVDAGGVPAGRQDGPRAAALRGLDALVGRLSADAPSGATLIVAGLADTGLDTSLHALIAANVTEPGGPYAHGWLATRSTRRVALVQLTDLTPTLLRLVGGVPPRVRLVGSLITPTPGRSAALPAAARRLAAIDRADSVVTGMIGGFFTAFGVVGGVLLLCGLLLSYRRTAGGTEPNRRARAVTAAIALGIAATPIATFLANAVDWGGWPHPALALAGMSLAIAGVIVTVALVGPWRRSPVGPVCLVCAISVAVLTIDVATGSNLELNALFGLSPSVGGRFYGLGNTAWALYATAAVLLAGLVGGALAARGRKGMAVLAVAAIGAATAVSDGWPGLGSDFGGMVALVPGFALLALLIAGVRVSPGRLGVVAAGSLVAVSAVAALDWLRPPDSRTHLGAFVQQLLDGDAAPVLGRKIAANLHSFAGPGAFAVPLAYVLLAVVIWAPRRLRAYPVAASYDRIPGLRATVITAFVVAVLGFVANDSGTSIPAVCLLVGVPLAVAVMLAEPRQRVAPVAVEPREPTTTPQP